ncbi:hypothetical protein WMY93_033743 [Mugilogobius chulae]|uniref:Uncharacterized protein n=1 Tax=Mugilogobius chulae TaxID=88201 RepID=A0AAW0MSC7_9GOBI
MEIPLPPALLVEDFTSCSGRKQKPPELCPPMELIFTYATRDWTNPSQQAAGGVMSRKAPFWTGPGSPVSCPSRTVSGSPCHHLPPCGPPQSSHGFTIDEGKTMAAAQVAARHLRLRLSNFKDQEKHQLLNSPISTTFVFSPDMQNIVDRLDAASKALVQVVSHLQSTVMLTVFSLSGPEWRKRVMDVARSCFSASRDRAPPRVWRPGRSPPSLCSVCEKKRRGWKRRNRVYDHE